MIYLLDSNIFVEAKNFHYPFDSFPGFWSWLKSDLSAGTLTSIKPILAEISQGNDELKEWVEAIKECGCFLPIDDALTQQKYTDIANWTFDSKRIFSQPAREEFLRVADSWLVAKAAALDATIVTREIYDKNCKRRIKIPNVCEDFGVEYIDTVELIRRKGIKFGII